jgi:multisubunit Na+/H+ antiporter MnhB subunit
MDDPSDWETRYGRMLRTIGLIISVAVVVLVCTVLVLLLLHTGFDFWQDDLKEHFLGTLGLIGLIVVAFGTVTFLRQSEGPIEFEALGMKFKGAAGQVVLWAFCLIVLSLCAKLLW